MRRDDYPRVADQTLHHVRNRRLFAPHVDSRAGHPARLAMHVGRRTKRGRAIVVLLLDEDVPPPEVMEEISKAGARGYCDREIEPQLLSRALEVVAHRKGGLDGPIRASPTESG